MQTGPERKAQDAKTAVFKTRGPMHGNRLKRGAQVEEGWKSPASTQNTASNPHRANDGKEGSRPEELGAPMSTQTQKRAWSPKPGSPHHPRGHDPRPGAHSNVRTGLWREAEVKPPGRLVKAVQGQPCGDGPDATSPCRSGRGPRVPCPRHGGRGVRGAGTACVALDGPRRRPHAWGGTDPQTHRGCVCQLPHSHPRLLPRISDGKLTRHMREAQHTTKEEHEPIRNKSAVRNRNN